MPLLQHITSRGWNITSVGEKWIIQSGAKKEFGVHRFIYQQHISFSKQSTQQNHQSHFQTIALSSLSERWLQFRSAGGNLWRVPATWGQLWKMTGEAVLEFLHQERGPSAPLLPQRELRRIDGEGARWKASIGTVWRHRGEKSLL